MVICGAAFPPDGAGAALPRVALGLLVALTDAIARAGSDESAEFPEHRWKDAASVNILPECVGCLVPAEACSPAAQELRDKIWSGLEG